MRHFENKPICVFSRSIKVYCNACCAGYLSAELRNANGTVPVDVVRRDRDRHAVSFVPLVEGKTDRICVLTPPGKS